MAEVTVRELRDQVDELVDRVEAGERVTITRGGSPVAELVPVRRAALTLTMLRERRRALPLVDPRALRADFDRIIDPAAGRAGWLS